MRHCRNGNVVAKLAGSATPDLAPGAVPVVCPATKYLL